jgi:hypothetical protein
LTISEDEIDLAVTIIDDALGTLVDAGPAATVAGRVATSGDL